MRRARHHIEDLFKTNIWDRLASEVYDARLAASVSAGFREIQTLNDADQRNHERLPTDAYGQAFDGGQRERYADRHASSFTPAAVDGHSSAERRDVAAYNLHPGVR